MKKIVIVLLLALSLQSRSFAKSNDESLKDVLVSPLQVASESVSSVGDIIFNLGSIRVSSSRIPQKYEETSYMAQTKSVSVIENEQLANSPQLSVADILSNNKSVVYSDDEGRGLGARVDLRSFGGEAKQALVVMDGVRVVEPFDNSVSWNLLPSEFFDTVAIYPGGSSPVYGEGALSGVVALKTKSPTKEWQVYSDNSIGSFHTYKNYLEVSGTTNNGLGLFLGGRYLESDGYRQNSDHENVGSLFGLTAEITPLLKLENKFYFVDSETGIAGPLLLSEVYQNRRQKDPDGQFGDKFTDNLYQNALKIDYEADPISAEVSNLLSYRFREQNSVQTFGGAFGGTSINQIGTETFSNVLQLSKRIDLSDEIHNASTLGVEWAIDDIHNPFTFLDPTFGPFSTDRSIDRRMLGAFYLNKLNLYEKLNLELGVRYDRIDWDIYDLLARRNDKEKNAKAISPNLSASYLISDHWTLYGGYSSSFKVPDANTLIFETPNLFTPNPSVDPSVAHHYELGTRNQITNNVFTEADVFYVETKKEILFNDLSNLNENFDTRRSGIEASANYQVSKEWLVGTHYSYTEAEFDGGVFAQKDIPLVPKHRWGLTVKYLPDEWWTLTGDVAAVSDRYALNDFNNLFPADDYWTLDLRIQKKINENGQAYLSFVNLLNEEYSSFVTSNGVDTVNYNPAPEFQFEFGFKLKFE